MLQCSKNKNTKNKQTNAETRHNNYHWQRVLMSQGQDLLISFTLFNVVLDILKSVDFKCTQIFDRIWKVMEESQLQRKYFILNYADSIFFNTLENILYRVGCLWKIKAGFAMEELEASEIVSRVAAEGEVPNFKHFCFPAFSSPTRGLVNRSTRWKWWWKRWCPLFFYRLKSDSRVRSFIELARLRLLTTPLIVQPNPFNVTSGGQKYCHFSHFSFSVNITFFNCHQLRCHHWT